MLEDKIQNPSKCLFHSEAMFWIIEVEIVVNDLKITGLDSGFSHFPNFEMLDARIASALVAKIASALNKIIQNFQFKKFSLEDQKAQKEDRFLRGFMIHDNFRVAGAHDTALDYADLFSITPPNDVQAFDSRWDENLLSMTKIPPDDALESL